MEGNCARSRKMEGFSDGAKDSNRVINASEENEDYEKQIINKIIPLSYYKII